MAAPRVLNASMRGGPTCVARAAWRTLRRSTHSHARGALFPHRMCVATLSDARSFPCAAPHALPPCASSRAARLRARCAGASRGGRSASPWRTRRPRGRCAARPSCGRMRTCVRTSPPAAPRWRRSAYRRVPRCVRGVIRRGACPGSAQGSALTMTCACVFLRVCVCSDGVCAGAGGAAVARGAGPDRGGVQPAGGGLGHAPAARHAPPDACQAHRKTSDSLFPFFFCVH
jgi:hypothetical protein